ncbi:Alpha/beta hydrolase [Hyphomicrobiales bacterium]|nr:Alpha/beta hydrolase [Hyphomicrobiales bacterium]CAH1671426.1 Pimeloyl-ACP methyl ester carboxylesterase [Hyphomicrobiales bacterium]
MLMLADNPVQLVRSADGAAIAIERTGRGAPLLLVHGTSSKRGRWQPVLARLAADREVITMDRRGRGDSGDRNAYHIEREFEDVARVVEHIGGRVDVLGHSYGAICAIGACRMTASIDRLVLYEPPLGSVRPENPTADLIDERVSKGDLAGGLVAFLSGVLGLSEQQVAAVQALPNWPSRLDVVPTIARELRTVQHFRFAPEELRAAVAHETLLIMGADSQPAFKSAIMMLGETMPNSRVTSLAGQQHQAIDLAPDLFVDAVEPFLRTASAAGRAGETHRSAASATSRSN